MSGAIAGRGAAGPQGPAGPEGQSATIAVGAVSAVPAAAPAAQVINVGTSSAAVFDFSFELPKGDKGDPGATGQQGPTGPTGPAPVFGAMAATSIPAGQTPYVSMVGTGIVTDPLLLTFGIPAGATGAPPVFGSPQTGSPGTNVQMAGSGTAQDPFILTIPRGDQGVQGADGRAATIAVGTVSALAPDAAPTVSNSGTATDAVFDFGFPTVQGFAVYTTTGDPIDVNVTFANDPVSIYPTGSAYRSMKRYSVTATETNWCDNNTSKLYAGTTVEALGWRGVQLAVLPATAADVTSLEVDAEYSIAEASSLTQGTFVAGSTQVPVTASCAANAALAVFAGKTINLTVKYPRFLVLATNGGDLNWGSQSYSSDSTIYVDTTSVVFSAVIQADGSFSANQTFTWSLWSVQSTTKAYPANVKPAIVAVSLVG